MSMARTSKKATAGTGDNLLRFEATVHAGPRARTLARVADLDLDRIPDPSGDVRVLVSAEELARLLDDGYEVHVHGALRQAPLDPGLVLDDDAAVRWLEEMVEGIPREEGS